MQFTSIKKDNRKNIINAFGGSQIVFDKSDGKIEKAIEFIKTGKELRDQLEKRIDFIKQKVALIKGKQKELSTAIGYEPDDSFNFGRDDIVYNESEPEVENNIELKKYKVDYEKMSQEDSVSNSTMFGINGTGENKKTERFKISYNDLNYTLRSCFRKIEELETIKRNIKLGTKNKLDIYELKKYGF